MTNPDTSGSAPRDAAGGSSHLAPAMATGQRHASVGRLDELDTSGFWLAEIFREILRPPGDDDEVHPGKLPRLYATTFSVQHTE